MAYTAGIVEEKDKQTITSVAEGTINPYRICRFGTAGNGVLQASAATQFPVGISGNGSENGKDSYATGDPVTLTRAGIKYLEMSGTGSKGNRVMSDADGKGVQHSSQDNSWVIGEAMENWEDGQIIAVEINKQFIAEAVGS